MYTLAPDEKVSLVIVYTQDMLVRGELVTQKNVRVSIWLRTQGVPDHIHLLNAQVLHFAVAPARSFAYSEFYLPAGQIVAMHLAPPQADPLDYDPAEVNRRMVPLNALIGSFLFKGQMRVATQTGGLGTSLDIAHAPWLSIYEVEITNPSLPQMPAMHAPMVLVRPSLISIGIDNA
jgi:hypothetical protein